MATGMMAARAIFRTENRLVLGIMLTLSCLLMVVGGAAMLGGVIVRVIWAVGERQKAMLQDRYTVRTPAELGHEPPPEPTLAETLTREHHSHRDNTTAPNGHPMVGTHP